MIEYENLKKSNQKFFLEYEKSFSKILKSGWYILGKQVQKFEENFSKYLNIKNCVGVANGLDALTIAIQSLNLPKESEILVPSNTYVATVLAIINNGHKPVLVEPKLDTYNIDPKEIEKKITSKTKAILIVHLYGKPCEMDEILRICKKNHLFLLEDCAQSHGATYKNQMTGTFGDFGCFSFYPTKNLGAIGDAGALVCHNDEFYQKVKKIRNYGSGKKYYNEEIGCNSRLDEIQAGFLNIKLKFLDKFTSHKRKLANIYLENLNNKFILPKVEKNYFDVYHIFNIRHEKRDQLKEFLLKKDIKTEIHYPIPPHKQEALKSFFKGEKFPIAEEIHKTTLSLPIAYFHTENDIMKVCKVMNKF